MHSTLIDAIMSLYTNTTAKVKFGWEFTDSFDTTSGVLQGDTLAPYLFVLVMDSVMWHSILMEEGFTVRRRLSRRYPAVKLAALAYADDLALLSDNAYGAQQQLHRLEKAADTVGIKINVSKCRVISIGLDNLVSLKSSTDEALPVSEDFCYLGS